MEQLEQAGYGRAGSCVRQLTGLRWGCADAPPPWRRRWTQRGGQCSRRDDSFGLAGDEAVSHTEDARSFE